MKMRGFLQVIIGKQQMCEILSDWFRLKSGIDNRVLVVHEEKKDDVFRITFERGPLKPDGAGDAEQNENPK
jgi:hypothetical protein